MASFDPLDPSFVADPHAVFSALREREPVHRSPGGAWVLTRYDDVFAALSDPRLGNAPSPYAVVNGRNRHRYVCADVAHNIIPFKDAPEHTPARKLIGRSFKAGADACASELRSMADRVLAAPREQSARGLAGELDVLHDFGTPFSLAVMCRLLGVPEADGPQLKAWSESFFYLFSMIPSDEVRERLDRDLIEFRRYFAQAVAARREQPGDDLISTMLEAGQPGEGLSEAELIDTCMLLFADGIENVDRAVAIAAALLLAHREQLETLRTHPELMPQAVDECLRFESPAQFVGRVALEDLEIHGVEIRRHAAVLLVLGSANRDSRQFPDADRFDIRRPPRPHLAFGRARHSCIGGPLVRLELAAALQALFEGLPRLAARDPELRWEARLGHRWLEAFPARF